MYQKCKELFFKYEEIIVYLIVGVLNTIISLCVYFLCTYTFLDPEIAWQLQIANILQWIAGVSFGYVMNRKYVFKSQNKQIFKELSAFVFSRLLTLFLDIFVMFLLVTCLHNNDKIAKFISAVLVTIANYVFSKLITFRKKKPEEESPPGF